MSADPLASFPTEKIGRRQSVEDIITAAPVAALMATFGRSGPVPVPGDPLPPLWHGLFCTTKTTPSNLADDGLPKEAAMPSPVPEFPRRLFGGARYRFRQPLRIGQAIRKDTILESMTPKQGRSGPFLVAQVIHRIFGDGELAVVEENDIILRPRTSAPPGTEASPPRMFSENTGETAGQTWSQTVTPDIVLMFRHSALTFNSHRIHYDRDYVRSMGFPGLLVQGTLIARLMLEMVRREVPHFQITGFRFRSGNPIYDDGDFTLLGRFSRQDCISLAAFDHAGRPGMTAEATGSSASP